MEFKETLFKRTLVKRYDDPKDEENNKMAEELAVTKEVNGYALWYQGLQIVRPRIIAWVSYEKDDLIAYAATLRVLEARDRAEEGSVNYGVPRLHDQALDPVV
jgi:hypothetical protein